MRPILLITLVFLSFVFFNTLNTYFLTRKKFNRYIVPFRHTFIGEVNSLLGNTGTLLLFVTFGILMFKNMYYITLYLLILTLIFNLIFFAMSVFNLYFGNAFSKSGFEIFKNPAGGISKGLFREILREFIIYYRFILFLPTILLTLLFSFTDKNELLEITVSFKPLTYIIYIIVTLALLLTSFILYKKMFKRELPIDSTQSTFAIQNFGVYPYYLLHFLFPSFENNILKLLKIENDLDLIKKVNLYNKNQSTYSNKIDNKSHSNTLLLKDISETITLDSSLLNTITTKGLFKDKNLVLVQVESFNKFLLEVNETKNDFVFLKKLAEESLVFENFFTSIGIGVSSDAEVTTLTGLFPSGTENYYWHNYDRLRKKYHNESILTTLPKYFKKSNYNTKAIHGDQKVFYNRVNAYKDLIGFNDFYSLESFTNKKVYKKIGPHLLYKYYFSKSNYHISPWASDYELFDDTNSLMEKETGKYMYFPITMMPHTPFEYHPSNIKIKTDPKYTPLTNKYLSSSKYYDAVIKRLFFNSDGLNITNPNNIYLFYGDHGSGLQNDDLFTLYEKNKKDDPLLKRKELQRVTAFLYVPSRKLNNNNIYKGLIKGKQELVRGQMDVYSTIIDLFDLEVNSDLYFGTHLLSKEKTFVLDNKLLDVATDLAFFSLRNPSLTSPVGVRIPSEHLKIIKEVKLLNDLMFKKSNMQKKINDLLNKREN